MNVLFISCWSDVGQRNYLYIDSRLYFQLVINQQINEYERMRFHDCKPLNFLGSIKLSTIVLGMYVNLFLSPPKYVKGFVTVCFANPYAKVTKLYDIIYNSKSSTPRGP